MNYQNRLNALFSEFTAMSQKGNVPNLEKADYKKLIDHCFSAEKFEEALEINEAAIQFFPFSSEFVVNKIELLLLIDQPYLALNLFDSVDHLTSHSKKVLLLKAECLDATGAKEAALEILKSMNEEKQNDYSVLELQARIMESLNQFDALYHVTKSQIMAAPKNQLGHLLTKHLFFTELTENHGDAIDFYRKVVDLHPFSSAAWFNLGCILKATNAFEDAIDAFEYSIAINAKNKYAYMECADCYDKLGQPNKSITHYHEYLANEKEIDPEILVKLGHCFIANKDYPQALQVLIKAVLLNPELDEGHFLLGKTFLSDNEPRKAISPLQKAIELNPLDEFYILALAEAYWQIDDIESAHHYFSESVERAPDIIDTWAAYIHFLIATEQHEELEDAVEGAYAGFCEEEVIYLRIASLFARKKRQQALYFLGEALISKMGDIRTLFKILPSTLDDTEVLSLIHQYQN